MKHTEDDELSVKHPLLKERMHSYLKFWFYDEDVDHQNFYVLEPEDLDEMLDYMVTGDTNLLSIGTEPRGK